MLRIPFFYLKLWALLIFYNVSYRSKYISLKKESKEKALEFLYFLKKQWSKTCIELVGINLTLSGEENLHALEGKEVVFVTNHQGSFDIPCLYHLLPANAAFVAKKELFTIPLLGFWMYETNCVPINRSSPREGMKSIIKAAELIKKGTNFVIFPEGTRSRDPEGKMLPFKRGSLKLALKSKATILPLAIEGTRHVFSKTYNKKSVKVHVSFGEAISTENMTKKENDELSDTIYRIVSDLHENSRKEVSKSAT